MAKRPKPQESAHVTHEAAEGETVVLLADVVEHPDDRPEPKKAPPKKAKALGTVRAYLRRPQFSVNVVRQPGICGDQVVNVGDFVVTDAAGCTAYPPDTFHALFEPVEGQTFDDVEFPAADVKPLEAEPVASEEEPEQSPEEG